MEDARREFIEELANKVIGAAFEVANVLGTGFLERVYENALVQELKLRGIGAETQKRVRVTYKGQYVGDYCVDILVEKQLLVELKVCESLAPEHVAQALNYLRATGLGLALLLNFKHPRIQIKRVVLNF